MDLVLTPAERDLLEGILKDALGSLREEVYHSETARFKDDLKADESLLRGILAKLALPVAKTA
ncbi:MAG: hypothetical protein ACM3JH_07985 [Acidithiobacillales bacterium]